MKTKIKFLVQSSFSLLLLLIFYTNCEKDDLNPSNRATPEPPPYKVTLLNKNTINNEKIIRTIQKINSKNKKLENNKKNNKLVQSNNYNFSIDTNFCKYIENANQTYHSYTFPIIRNDSINNVENLLLSLQEDGTYLALLVSYNLTEQEKNDLKNKLEVNLENKVTFTQIDDSGFINNIFSRFTVCGITFQTVCWETSYNCDCLNYPTTTECETFTSPMPCSTGGESSGAGTSGNGTNGGSGSNNGNSSANTTPINPDVTAPIILDKWEQTANDLTLCGNINNPNLNTWVEANLTVATQLLEYLQDNECNDEDNLVENTINELINGNLDALEDFKKKKECKKIKKLFEDFPSYKTELINLAGTVNENHENGKFVDNNSSSVQNIPTGTGGKIDINNNPANPYVSIAHTHDAYGDDGLGTYSVFSWDDLALITNLTRNGHIKTNKFVAFLMTAKGTRYALTINNASKLQNFFYNPEQIVGNTVDVDRLLKMELAYKDYYEEDNAKIKVTNTNNNEVQIAFLQMLRDNDIGISVFNVDANFESFDALTLENNNTTVTPDNCNE